MRRDRLLFASTFALIAGCGGGTNTNNPDGGTTGCPNGLIKFDNVCVLAPTQPATRTPCGDVSEFCDKMGTTAPVLSCLSGPAKMHPAMPATVTLTGYIHPFSGGKSNAPVHVQVYKASDLEGGKDITAVTPIAEKEFPFDPTKAADPTQFRACDGTEKIGPMIGCVPVDPSACKPACADGLPDGNGGTRPDNNKYCLTKNGVSMCSDRLRWERRYAIDNIPTNTPLVIRSSGEGGKPQQGTWNTLVQWNVFLPSDAPSCGGDGEAVDCMDTRDMAHPKYQLNVNVLSQADYGNIPVSAGLAAGISPNLGAVAGEVHDCDNIRIGSVMVGVSPAGERLTYFNGNPYNTVPDSSRAATGTDRLGLFTSLNIKPGAVTVQAVGLVSGMPVSLGKYTAYTYPGVVSVVNINGGRPVQQ